MKNICLLLATFLLLISCNGQENKNETNTAQKQPAKNGTVTFISFWNKENQNVFVALENGKQVEYLFQDSISRKFNRGDELEISLDETKTIADEPVVTNAKLLKAGALTDFLAKHDLKIQYEWNYECDGGFITKSYSIVQYYFSVSKNPKAKQALVDLSKNVGEQHVRRGNKIIDYIIEKETVIDNKKLIMLDIGIFTYGPEGNRTKIQNIYYESETDQLYEVNESTHQLEIIK